MVILNSSMALNQGNGIAICVRYTMMIKACVLRALGNHSYHSFQAPKKKRIQAIMVRDFLRPPVMDPSGSNYKFQVRRPNELEVRVVYIPQSRRDGMQKKEKRKKKNMKLHRKDPYQPCNEHQASAAVADQISSQGGIIWL